MSKSEKVFIVGSDFSLEGMWKKAGYTIAHKINQADIVQFIGGADVDPSFYGERQLRVTRTNPSSDARDNNAWSQVNPNQLLVGVCRGGQFLNVKSGGSMWQHVSGHCASHTVVDTLGIGPDNMIVSSTHHQMMIPGDGAEILAFTEGVATAHTSDKVGQKPSPFDYEVLYYKKTRSLCFQPHPEYNGYPDCTRYFFDLIDLLR